ncbi:hypothetical protein M433DRAFT_20934 [Acidomyces richmondensis BFW]|nr:hypothetical protein M433DRAFT_20934 [Acidomyces richmondensis BFW]
MAAAIAKELNINPQRRDYLLNERDIRYEYEKTRITIGRYALSRDFDPHMRSWRNSFSMNRHASSALERVAAAVVNREPLLLVGETGVGKTTAVQYLARQLGKSLESFNLSQQSEAGDLLGAFKPVTARTLIIPMQNEFDELFHDTFSTNKNQKFLELLGKQVAKNNWKAVCKLWRQALRMVSQQRSHPRSGEAPSKKRKLENSKRVDYARWDSFARKLDEIEKRLAAGGAALAFSFVEGNFIKAVRNGNWVLLDEINLASPDTLEAIADVLDPIAPSLLLTEAGSVERIDAHPDFRIFAAMNPATDVGKKDLPPSIRSRFTEQYVESPDKDIRSLQDIVHTYLRAEIEGDSAVALDISTLYQKIVGLVEENKLVDGAGQQPHFSLRTLTRTLTYAKYIAPQCSIRRALYEGCQMSFLTLLDAESAHLVQPLLEKYLLGKRMNIHSELKKALRKPTDGFSYTQAYPGSKHWLRVGFAEPEQQPHYILTPFIEANLENLVRASSTRQFPVLIQGPTSSGKTSMIEYLAKRTGHKFVRINNHEHTDLQEYFGTYVSDPDGKLQFQEGVLVRAIRNGHWIVLDELNLAPTDVLEALNRLLDDNRELFIPETQEVVRPHENFMLFATQNPAGLYGGRKALSRAFRNRFLELHFDDIPIEQLQVILHRRTQLPESRCKRIVTVYRELSVLRQESRLFEQKSFATLRDLFRWAMRPNDTIEQLASNGFMLLAERVRKPEERLELKSIIERVMSANGPRVVIDENALYAEDTDEIQAYVNKCPHRQIVWTKAMRRLYVLVCKAIRNNEPVLLVGETGCGKTTVCEMLAELQGKTLHTLNAHQNTETGDLIGSQRPVRNRGAVEAELRRKVSASEPLKLCETVAALSTDELLKSYDQAVLSLNNADQQNYRNSQTYIEIQDLRLQYNAIFEWVDGSLVQAMKEGSLFLLDEISLADDSVLERINSVLESSRSILLAEKGSLDSFVTAASGFQFLATMNPGGDYGKRELSPALRNRFTEIWVPALSDTEDILQIVCAQLSSIAKRYAEGIVSFATWFKRRYNTSASPSISIREVLAWVHFINSFSGFDIATALVHGAAMVYIDTLGANPAGLMNLSVQSIEQERESCLAELGRLLNVEAAAIYYEPAHVVKSSQALSIGPFSIVSRDEDMEWHQDFTFDAQTVRFNSMRLARALQLSKPVMLEGNPGVGKTALITALAHAVGIHLARINLSEQTDLMDLFGCDAPVEGTAALNFQWRDAPFLTAMKRGDWVLLDEMNLASQSVLEGLNACLDHRGEVFVPELGQSFSKHPNFRLFAAQNPHHQGGGRKGLPASFVNRFTVVYADALRSDDLMHISQRSFPQVDSKTMQQVIRFVERLDLEVAQLRRYGANGGPWEFNLRDIIRWCTLMVSEKGLLKAGNPRDFANLLFMQRFRSSTDRAFVIHLFELIFKDVPQRSDLFSSISPSFLQLGLATLDRDHIEGYNVEGFALPKHPELFRTVESVMLCVQQSWPVVLVGSSGSGKTSLLESLAAAVGQPLTTVAMNSETDAMDFIGGYEQCDHHRQIAQAAESLRMHLRRMAKSNLLQGKASSIMEALAALDGKHSNMSESLKMLHKLSASLSDEMQVTIRSLINIIQKSATTIEKARFEWTDGVLVDALMQGKWLVLDNANLCSPSVLDRLNSLLEQDGALIMNEHTLADGSPRIIRPHSNFRIFLTVDPRYGELSRAMRNRAVELYLPIGEGNSALLDPLAIESAMARFHQCKVINKVGDESVKKRRAALFIHDHMALRDVPLIPRLDKQLNAGLYQSITDDFVHKYAQDSAQQDIDKGSLAIFYEAAAIEGRMPADFAHGQTFHALNNQAYIQQNQHAFCQALVLAFIRDMNMMLNSTSHQLLSAQTNQKIVRQLVQLERSWLSVKISGNSISTVIATIGHIVKFTLHWIRQLNPMPFDAFQQLKSVLYHFCSLWRYIIHLTGTTPLDQASLRAWVLVARRAVQRASSMASNTLQSLLTQVSMELEVFESNANTVNGRACENLWKALKPATPVTMAQMGLCLEFRQMTEIFDTMPIVIKQSLEDASNLRLSFVRALRTALTGTVDLNCLIERLKNLMPDMVEDFPNAKAHFSEVFESICMKFSALSLESFKLPVQDLMAIELLAGRDTKRSLILAPNDVPLSAQDYFHRLACKLTRNTVTREDISRSDWALMFLEGSKSAADVSLGKLHLLESETTFIARLVANRSHQLCSDTFHCLNACLQRLLAIVLHSIANDPNDAELRAMGSGLLRDLHRENGTSQMRTESCLSPKDEANDTFGVYKQLNRVVRYLRHQDGDRASQMQRAASAWAAFAWACMTLYVPSQPFDPALVPRIEQAIHRYTVESLTAQLQTLQSFRELWTGDHDVLRVRVLQCDIQSVGPEPEIELVCRPQSSELTQLQSDFDGLLRILNRVQGLLNDDGVDWRDFHLWKSLEQTKAHLEEKHSYRDLTAPIVGFIDCLRVSLELRDFRESHLQKRNSIRQLPSLIPFVEASYITWCADEAFENTFATTKDLETIMFLLTIFAARCAAWPLASTSTSLRRCVDFQFARLYEQWKRRLNEDQKSMAAKKSLYRYTGSANIDDVSDKELHELFPNFEDGAIPQHVSSNRSTNLQDVAHEVTFLHHSIYRNNGEQIAILDIISRYAKLSNLVSLHENEQSKHLIPTIFVVLRELATDRNSFGNGNPHSGYNIYVHRNVEEVKKMLPILQKVERKFRALSKVWPEHATPVEVLRLVAHILEQSHSQPIMMYLLLIEKLHSTIYQWQQIASREFDVGDLLGDLTNLIVSWRQLELSSWAALLNYETAAWKKHSSQWWFIAYETIISASQSLREDPDELKEHARGLLATLGDFLSNCGLGEYSARLNMLRDFEAHLGASAVEVPALDIMRQALTNFISYYEHYEPAVEERLAEGRASIESEIQTIIQLASWKDRNIEILRQSAKSSHKKLLKLVQKYRILLGQPVNELISGLISSKRIQHGKAEFEGDREFKSCPAVDRARKVTEVSAWSDRPKRYVNIAVTVATMESKASGVLKSMNAAERLSLFTEDLNAGILELKRLTPAIMTQDNKSTIQRLKGQKRRLLADVLRDLRAMGFQSNLNSNVIANQSNLSAVLANNPAIPARGPSPLDEITDCDFHRFLGIMPAVREGLRQHSDDLTSAEVVRCVTLLESILQTSIHQRANLLHHHREAASLGLALKQLNVLIFSDDLKICDGLDKEDLRSRTKCLSLMIRACIELLQAQKILGGCDYSEYILSLERHSQTMTLLLHEIEDDSLLWEGLQNRQTVSLQRRFIDAQNDLKAFIAAGKTNYPQLEHIFSHLDCWLIPMCESVKPRHTDSASPTSVNEWTINLLQSLDEILASVHALEQPVQSNAVMEKDWLLQQLHASHHRLKAARIGQITKRLSSLLATLQYCHTKSDLSDLINISSNVQPILAAFSKIVYDYLARFRKLNEQVASLGCTLAASFVTLAKQGFCSPSENAEADRARGENLEPGTGLGEGEGAENISKDLMDDEDLSELAHERQHDEQQENVEESEDAVDMADQDLTGHLEEGKNRESDEIESETGEEMDEEIGDVEDSALSTLDEKMWNDPEDGNGVDGEADQAPSSSLKQDATTAQKSPQNFSNENSNGEEDESTPSADDEAEKLSNSAIDHIDSHTEDRQNLELPEDMAMDGRNPDEETENDVDSWSEGDARQLDYSESEDAEEKCGEEIAAEGLADEKHMDEDKIMDEVAPEVPDEDYEQPNSQDSQSDIIMRDDNSDVHSNADDPAVGQTGIGPDINEREAPHQQESGGALKEETKNVTTPKSDSTIGAKGLHTDNRAERVDGATEDVNENVSENVSENITRVPFKKISDTLDDWYWQNRQIHPSEQVNEPNIPRPEDIDMNNTELEHLPDNETVPDTQALGAASTEQSTALNTENCQAMNNEQNDDRPPMEEIANENQIEENEDLRDSSQNEQEGEKELMKPPNAFVGDNQSAEDFDIRDILSMGEDDQLESVDRKMSNTHLDQDETVEPLSIEEARRLWAEHEASTRNLALMLTEHLRLILQPTQATKMRGDFRTGKRLNIKRIIPFIASSYKRDKIWMRRSVPSKRSYQVMLAIDDSRSMAESDSRDLAFDTMALVAKAMSVLEVGELGIVRFGESVHVAHDFNSPFTSEAGAKVFKNFTFAQSKTNIRMLLSKSIELFRSERLRAVGSAADLWQLQLIISDGVCEDHSGIRRLVRQAQEEKIMVVFIIVDAAGQNTPYDGRTKQSILDLQTAEFDRNDAGEMEVKMVKYLDTFPFNYYLIVRDVQELPAVLAGALRQWFAEVVDSAG